MSVEQAWLNWFVVKQSFKKYMTHKRDFNELVLHLLRGLVKDALRVQEMVSRPNHRSTHIEIKIDDLEAKVRHWSISSPFSSKKPPQTNSHPDCKAS